MNGNQMDITCANILSADSVDCSNQNISDLTGIEYFTNIVYLNCSGNAITGPVPMFPSSITELHCNQCNISNFNAWPQQLQILTCEDNPAVSLPTLPGTLIYLDCDGCSGLGSLPLPIPYNLQHLDISATGVPNSVSLPASLTSLGCSHHAWTSLPALPPLLDTLFCEDNQLTALPQLPSTLTFLDVRVNSITSVSSLPSGLSTCMLDYNELAALPSLPDSLTYLSCSYNYLTQLPALPEGLTMLYCENNNITSLPALPSSLYMMSCSSNKLTALPVLPEYLYVIDCSNNQLSSLPALAQRDGLQLDCSNNLLTSLPALPPYVMYDLYCEYNNLTSLPALPTTLLFDLDCSHNDLTSLPALPQTVVVLDCSSNPHLSCLPVLTSMDSLIFDSTAIACVPNYVRAACIPALNTLPLCGIFNPNGCEAFWNISGRSFYDTSNTCIFDSDAIAEQNIKVLLTSNGVLEQQVFTDLNGLYSFQTGYGNYAVSVDTGNLPFALQCPDSGHWNKTIDAADSLIYNNNFVFKYRTAGFDLGVQSIADYNIIPRRSVFFTLHTIAGDISELYGAHCAAGIAGQVQLTFSGPVTFKSPANGALTPAISGDTLTWAIADFGNVNDTSAFNTVFQIDSVAAVGTTICFAVNVSSGPGDFNPYNNTLTYCFPVVNGLDPNEKEVYPTAVDSANQWLTYTVRFQNTGTAPAVNIIVRDTLSPNVDASTFQLLTYSAKNLTQIFGNVVVFNFPNINLPDSLTSDSASRGFVQYRVKTIANLQPGNVVSNTASIYFDLNAPVVTNTVTDTFSIDTLTGIKNIINLNNTISLYPNPTNNLLYIKTEGIHPETITIYDVEGRDAATMPYTPEIDVHNLVAGVYLLEITSTEGVARKRWVKM
jgi:uncharacterized repeat protein (TIGR01451 family)